MSHYSILKGAVSTSLSTSRVGVVSQSYQNTPVTLTSNSPTSISQISNLTAGYYEIWGRANILLSAGATIQGNAAGVYSSATTAFNLDGGLCCQTFYGPNASLGSAQSLSIQLPRQRITILNGSTSNIILAVKVNFTSAVGTVTCVGYVAVERVA
jgi:hypothetical protein